MLTILYWNSNFAISKAIVEQNGVALDYIPLTGDVAKDIEGIATLVAKYKCEHIYTNDSRNRFLEPHINNKLAENYGYNKLIQVEVGAS